MTPESIMRYSVIAILADGMESISLDCITLDKDHADKRKKELLADPGIDDVAICGRPLSKLDEPSTA
ncbi:MAG: hypothetical protein NTW27_01610 [Deltaproteobacteria bacterium]|nr:hypothetical protein [Deltaproteobacteria bacterium]